MQGRGALRQWGCALPWALVVVGGAGVAGAALLLPLLLLPSSPSAAAALNVMSPPSLRLFPTAQQDMEEHERL